MSGWIKVHRKLLEWEWHDDPKMVALFLYIILKANHSSQIWRGTIIKKGQFITGLLKMSKDTGISVQSLRTCLRRLELTKEIVVKSTNKFTLVTIVNYEDYQINQDQPTNDQQTINNKQELIKNIIDYLNKKTESNYGHKTRKTINLIEARLNEKFTPDDFIKVIDVKTLEWIGTSMAKFLRPETLFGNKFESYLNQKTNDRTRKFVH